jgi:hypothetical protein
LNSKYSFENFTKNKNKEEIKSNPETRGGKRKTNLSINTKTEDQGNQ